MITDRETRLDVDPSGFTVGHSGAGGDSVHKEKKIDLPDEVSESVYGRMRAERGRVARDLRARGNPAKGQPADKAFRDSLYEDT